MLYSITVTTVIEMSSEERVQYYYAKKVVYDWPPPSLPTGKYTEHRLAGFDPNSPDNTLWQDALDWKVLNQKTKKERDKRVLARANHYTQIFPQSYPVGSSRYKEVIEDAYKNDRFSLHSPKEPLSMPVARIIQTFGMTPDQIKERLELEAKKLKNRMDFDSIQRSFKGTKTSFSSSTLNSELSLFINKNFKNIVCKQIIAFEGHSLGVAQLPE